MILQRLMRRVLTSPPGRRPGLRAGAAGLVVLSFSAVLLAPPSAADTGDEKRAADAQVADLEEQLSETSAELAQAYTALTQTQAQLPAARARLASAQSAARAAAKHNAEVAAALAVAQANAARAEEAVARNTATRDQTQRTLDAFAADLFQGGSVGQLSVALGATSADDFATRLVLADTVTAMTNQALNDLAAAKADGDANGAYLAAVQVEVTDLKRQAENALAAAEASRNEAQAASSALDALVAQQSGYAASVEAQRANEASQLAEAQAEQQRLQALLIEQARIAREREAARKAAEAAAQKAAEEAARKNGTAVPPPPVAQPDQASGFLSRPITGGRTSSEFGMRFHPIFQVWRLHTGLDFANGCSSPVYAAAPGTIIRAGWAGGRGNQIVIDHGIRRGVDLATTYNHLTSFVQRSGTVSRGQLIGYTGTTGNSTGCHLHFETLEDGQFVNPRSWL
ncbi:MAG: Murein DD-endopeptidase MepM [bacterium ADurb.BinA028]|jgi:murein DD-endopeptidase MepM/ murein hydrolase activator NlpD|nr:MAG: Murein DD-endopeptidase MepM [bacterium ADurb.BinA028]